jgi:biopolymer transport protein ExbD
MLVHHKQRQRLKVEIPLTSLIDIVFLLLIYFLLTIKLPQAKASVPQTEEVIVVYVDRQGRAFLGTQEVSLAMLFDRLREMIGGRQNKLVVIRADRAVILNKAVKVMDVAKAAGAGRLCLATEKDL